MRLFLLLLFSIVVIFRTHSQPTPKSNGTLFLGLNYGHASVNEFPFNNADYSYNNRYVKMQINYLLSKRKLIYELHMEPGIYFSEHQLLNQYFIQPNRGIDYLDQRARFTRRRFFAEYVVNLGIILRCRLLKSFSTYILGSIGPMISTQDTERLSKGFAFSDVFGCGLTCRQQKWLFELRLSVRHNSNLGLLFPNIGHNSIGIESGIWLQIR